LKRKPEFASIKPINWKNVLFVVAVKAQTNLRLLALKRKIISTNVFHVVLVAVPLIS
jgi:hypothetical protein